MKSSFLAKIWFPAAVMTTVTFATVDLPSEKESVLEASYSWTVPASSPDTVKYPKNGYKKGWTAEEMADVAKLDSAAIAATKNHVALDTTGMIWARDTIKVPDSLRITDPFRFKYYAALVDSFTHVWVRDSLRAAGDTIDWPLIDSIYAADSSALAKAKHLAWYNSLSKKEKKRYDYEQRLPKIRHEMDSVQSIKDSIKAVKDSITQNTPRVLQTGFIPDSLHYKRIISWTHDRDFHNLDIHVPDTSYNWNFNDYPFMKNDLGATWLGVAGSPVQTWNFFKREKGEGVSFYEAQESWSYSPSTLPMYNTKTPFTELCYWGTLLAGDSKESDNIRVFTTQNITPELNFEVGFIRFGGAGILQSEDVKNKTSLIALNYTGKKYLAHAGFIHNGVSRQENGGIVDTKWVRDTTVEIREVAVALSGAASKTSKTSFFVDQQIKIPFYFIRDRQDAREEAEWERHYRDSLAIEDIPFDWEIMEDYLDARWNKRELAREDSGEDLTSAFIGHSSEFSRYSRLYTDKITNAAGRDLFNGVFNYNPVAARDSMSVTKLDNKAFVRLQPWSSTSILSKIDVGVGDEFLSFFNFENNFLSRSSNVRWNSFYLYSGAEGQYKNMFKWDAKANYVLMGARAFDMSVEGNMKFTFYPFRRARKSPMTLSLHAETRLEEPDFYEQHFHGNHYSWDNNFGKASISKVRGVLDIPRFGLGAELGYALLDGNTYYDAKGIIRQNTSAMSVITAGLNKNLSFFDGFLHLDHKALLQFSSNQEVIPLPAASLNFRYYIQFPIENGIMNMQIGANAWYNTKWYTPGWNPDFGVFYNQREEQYNNGPVVDAFVNIQWKTCCIFIKYQNAGDGWLTDKRDFFTAHKYIGTTSGGTGLKLGIYWPFYTSPTRNPKVNASGPIGGGSGGGSPIGGSAASIGRGLSGMGRH